MDSHKTKLRTYYEVSNLKVDNMKTVGILILIIIGIFIIVMLATFFGLLRLFIIFPTSQGAELEKSSNDLLTSWKFLLHDLISKQNYFQLHEVVK